MGALRSLLFCVVAVLAAGGQSSAPSARERASAILQALSSGEAAAFEAAAQANYTPALLAHRTPEERAGFAARLASDFGHFTLPALIETPQGLRAELHNGDLTAAFTFQFDDAPDHRIASLSLSVEAGGGHGVRLQLPPPAINAAMSPQEMSAAVDAWMAPAVAHDDFSGVVLIAHDGQALFTRAYGLSNREN